MARPAYSELLRDPRWLEKRRQVLARDGYRCRECGSSSRLQVDHRRYQGNPWDVPNSALQTLCDDCHGRTTRLRRELKDIVEQMNSTDLAIAVDQLGSFEGPVLRPLKGILEHCQRARAAIVAQPYSAELGRRLEELDELEGHIYGILHAAAKENFA